MTWEDFIDECNQTNVWPFGADAVEPPELCELLETGSVTVTLGDQKYVVSLKVEEAI